MSLRELNHEWAAVLRSEKCPPVLGLAPFSESDAQAVTSLVSRVIALPLSKSPFETLLRLLLTYPAIMTVWLARKAGEAYEFGTFWEHFESKTGIKIPPPRRLHLAGLFRRECQHVMSNFSAPPRVGAFKHVEAFLFQAALPLCHCKRFASLVRLAERRYGLPHIDAPDAGEELRDHVIAYLGPTGTPTLTRALQGPAGPLICHAALRVILEGHYGEISPSLGVALEEAFTVPGGGPLRRAARQPYLRLSEDLGALEVVGPRQEPSLADGRGLRWIMNGLPYAVSSSDEFVFQVHSESRLNVELRGLRDALAMSRTFVLRLSDREQPFLIFDYESRRCLRDQTGTTLDLPCGQYWLLRSSASRLEPASESHEWADGMRALSLVTIDPGSQVTLTLGGSRAWVFKAAEAPFLRVPGLVLSTDDGEKIHYGWTSFPEVWRPHDDEVPEEYSWTLQIATRNREHSFELPTGEISGAMMRCQPMGQAFLKDLAPGIHKIDIAVFRWRRKKMTQSFWVWVGLKAYREGKEFELSAPAANLLVNDCHGFDVTASHISHRQDTLRQHTLAFDFGHETKLFRWSRAGIFLESFEKRPSRAIRAVSHKLGEIFPASIDSQRWLRIWQVPTTGCELIVGEQSIQRMTPAMARPFFDLSLAQLSVCHPNGGRIMMRSWGLEIEIATFTPPLKPLAVCVVSSHGFRSVSYEFADPVPAVRPCVQEIVSRQLCEYAEVIFNSDGYGTSQCGALPQIEFRVTRCASDGRQRFAVNMAVTESGWPSGFWIVELEARRQESGDWQVVGDPQGRRVPLLVASNTGDIGDRFRLLWSAFSGTEIETDGQVASFDGWLDLLSDTLNIMRDGISPEVARDFNWCYGLFYESARHIGRLLPEASGHDIARLLNLASMGDEMHESTPFQARSLFAVIPQILALSARHYCEISTVHHVARALQWCGRMAAKDLVVEFFSDLILETVQTGDRSQTFGVLQNFGNFAAVIQNTGDDPETEDFCHFDYERYWIHTIGHMEGFELQAEYDERNILGRTHVEWALCQLSDRIQRIGDLNEFGVINHLLNSAPAFRDWLRLSIQSHEHLMPIRVWSHPWLSVSFEESALVENCVRFASVLALAARASSAGLLNFDEVIGWLRRQTNSSPTIENAIATLVEIAAELSGYYLMFWELMIRTQPHA